MKKSVGLTNRGKGVKLNGEKITCQTIKVRKFVLAMCCCMGMAEGKLIKSRAAGIRFRKGTAGGIRFLKDREWLEEDFSRVDFMEGDSRW